MTGALSIHAKYIGSLREALYSGAPNVSERGRLFVPRTYLSKVVLQLSEDHLQLVHFAGQRGGCADPEHAHTDTHKHGHTQTHTHTHTHTQIHTQAHKHAHTHTHTDTQ